LKCYGGNEKQKLKQEHLLEFLFFYFLSVCNKGLSLLLGTAVPALLRQGVDGIFLLL